MSDLTDRLNEILPKVTSDDFLHGKGIGNEIAFYIFDYLPEDELAIREHVQFLLKRIPQERPGTTGQARRSARLRGRSPAATQSLGQDVRLAEAKGGRLLAEGNGEQFCTRTS